MYYGFGIRFTALARLVALNKLFILLCLSASNRLCYQPNRDVTTLVIRRQLLVADCHQSNKPVPAASVLCNTNIAIYTQAAQP